MKAKDGDTDGHGHVQVGNDDVVEVCWEVNVAWSKTMRVVRAERGSRN